MKSKIGIIADLALSSSARPRASTASIVQLTRRAALLYTRSVTSVIAHRSQPRHRRDACSSPLQTEIQRQRRC